MVCFSITIFNVSATDWFPVGAKWYWSAWSINPYGEYFTLEITKDTIISGKVYKIGEFTVFTESNSSGVKNIDATLLLTEDNGNIKYRYKNTDYRFYNTNLTVGDTMYTDFTKLMNQYMTGGCGYSQAISDTVLVAKSIVDSVKTVIINSQPFKKMYLHSIVEPPSYPIVISQRDFSIIERIGLTNTIGYFGNVGTTCFTAGYFGELRCYEDSSINYHWSLNISCDSLFYIISKNYRLPIQEDIVVFPNPTENNIILHRKTNIPIEYIEILDIYGNIISLIPFDENTIQLDSLHRGVYFLKINDNDKNYYIYKFIKK